MAKVGASLPDLTPLEERLLDHVAKGEEFDCAPEGQTPDDPDDVDDWDKRVIRAEILSALCLGELAASNPKPRRGVQLRGANVVGNLDLALARLEDRPLAFDVCRFADGMLLDNAHIGGFAARHCRVGEFSADELESTSSLYLEGSSFTQVVLTDVIIRGILECTEVRIESESGSALRADRLSAAAVFLTDGEVSGEISFSGARIASFLDCDAARLSNEGGTALNAERLSVGYVFLREAVVVGEINLLRAEIAANLECDGAKLSSEDIALNGDSLSAGAVFLSRAEKDGQTKPFEASGMINLVLARIARDLNCDGARLNQEGGTALYGEGLSAVSVFLREAEVVGEINLSRAEIAATLECDGATLRSEDTSLNGESLSAGAVLLRSTERDGHTKPFEATGQINLIEARIEGDLVCNGARLSEKGGTALFGEGLSAASVDLSRAEVVGEINLFRAQIAGGLDCDAARLSNEGGDALDASRLSVGFVFLREAVVVGEINLLRAEIAATLECDGATLRSEDIALNGDSLSAGAVFLRSTQTDGQTKPFEASGQINLVLAEIGDLNCDGARLIVEGGMALYCEGLSAGSVFLREAEVVGEINLLRAEIAASLECDGATLTSEDTSLNGESLSAGAVLLRSTERDGQTKPFEASGLINLREATIAGDLDCNGARLSNEDLTAFLGVGLSAHDVDLRDVEVQGGISLWDARIAGDLSCDQARFKVLVADNCEVGGTLAFDLKEPTHAAISLYHTQVGALRDDVSSWRLRRVDLRGFTYQTIEGADASIEERLEWIRRSQPYSPEVYSQLEAVYRNAGEERQARTIAVAREDDRRGQGNLSPAARAWNLFLSLTVSHGYRPWKALLYLAPLVFIGALLFSLPAANHAIVPTDTSVHAQISACTPDYPCFSAFVYAVDLALPVIDLHQENDWFPTASAHYGRWYLALTWVLISAGWLLTTAVLAGIASVWRRN